jgi:hypothetical protein
MRIPSDTSYPSKRKLFASVVALYGRQSWLANAILQLSFPKINSANFFMDIHHMANMGVKFICDANGCYIYIEDAILGIYLHIRGVGVYIL